MKLGGEMPFPSWLSGKRNVRLDDPAEEKGGGETDFFDLNRAPEKKQYGGMMIMKKTDFQLSAYPDPDSDRDSHGGFRRQR